jgi:2-dehydro-3-deoxyphosphooctonate aldolase (KDO 8-P synthase)
VPARPGAAQGNGPRGAEEAGAVLPGGMVYFSMYQKPCRVAGFEVGNDQPPFFMAGPCVIEDAGLVNEVAEELQRIFKRLDAPFVFKASFDKANRTSVHGFRGPGLSAGLAMLGAVKSRLGVPVVSDIHETSQVAVAAEVLDILQIPAFLCRQTDLVALAARTGLPVNIKKGQFLAPWDMRAVAEKVREAGNDSLLLTERGASFGYNNLVVDMRSLHVMKDFAPVIFDCTHSVQLPGGQGASSGGQREFIPTLMRAAAAVGVAGYFLECHPDPSRAKSDGPNAVPLDRVEELIAPILAIDKLTKQSAFPVFA